jgi:hypothetical protein
MQVRRPWTPDRVRYFTYSTGTLLEIGAIICRDYL